MLLKSSVVFSYQSKKLIIIQVIYFHWIVCTFTWCFQHRFETWTIIRANLHCIKYHMFPNCVVCMKWALYDTHITHKTVMNAWRSPRLFRIFTLNRKQTKEISLVKLSEKSWRSYAVTYIMRCVHDQRE